MSIQFWALIGYFWGRGRVQKLFLGLLICCQAQPKSKSQLGCAGSIPSFSVPPSVRPSGIVLSGQNWTYLSKAKLLVLMFRLQKRLQTLTLLVMGLFNPMLASGYVIEYFLSLVCSLTQKYRIYFQLIDPINKSTP